MLCEKPLCVSLAEMDRIEAAEQRTGNFCSSVFQYRFGSAGQHLKALIEAGALGKPLVAASLTTWWRSDAYYAVPWRGKWASASFTSPAMKRTRVNPCSLEARLAAAIAGFEPSMPTPLRPRANSGRLKFPDPQ